MIYTLVLSAGLLFGPHCEDGCKVLTGADTPPAGKYSAAQMFGYKGIGFHADGVGKIFAIHPTWTTERERILAATSPQVASTFRTPTSASFRGHGLN